VHGTTVQWSHSVRWCLNEADRRQTITALQAISRQAHHAVH